MARHLRLFTLGPPVLTSESGPVRFRTRKHFALLIRLGLECGRRFTREYLIDLLWADVPNVRGRHSLAQALSVLKTKVGRDRVLVAEATVAFAEGTIDADVGHVREGDVDIRGPFLDGFDIPGAVSFEHWKDSWRSKLAPSVRDALVRQMDIKRRAGDFAGLERHARILLELDPLSEDGVRGVVEARVWAGDRTNALKIYTRFAQRFSDELGAAPRPELRSLADSLREGRPPVARMRVAESRVPNGGNASDGPPVEPLIGREREFGRLYDAWQDARRGRPRVVVLTGDAGIGKTTLANAVAAMCQLEGAMVARVQAYDAERELPFTVLAELTRQLAAHRVIGGAEPDALSELARIAPELLDAFPGVPRPPEWATEVTPLRVADAFRRAVTAAGEDRPLVLIVDDVHATDNASAAILHVVARKLQDTRVLLILAGRSTELGDSDATTALTNDTVIKNLARVELEGLDPHAAAQLVERLLATGHTHHGDSPVTRIVRAANGNPLAVDLLAREWMAHGPESLIRYLEALDTVPALNLGIPRAIAEVFERQTQRLDRATRSVLDLAAVLGRRLADLSLYEAIDCKPGVAADGLSHLTMQAILREVRGVLEFRNELIRAQAYYAIGAPVRQHLHCRVADVLAKRVCDDRPSLHLEVAWHFLRGGSMGNAVKHGLAGAKAAIEVGAPREAQKLLEALLLQSEGEPANPAIHLLLARALLDQSIADAALNNVAAITALAGLQDREFADASRMQATAYYLTDHGKGAGHYGAADEALQAAQRAKDPELIAKALLEFARSGAEAGDHDRVRVAQEQIKTLLKGSRAAELSYVHTASAFCHYLVHEPAAAARCLETAKTLVKPEDAPQLSFIHNGYGNCEHHLCNFASARHSYLLGLELARSVGDDCRSSIISSNLCAVVTTMGDYTKAIDAGTASVEHGLRALNQPLLMDSFLNLGEAFALAGDGPQALACLERARECAERRRTWATRIELLCHSAALALVLGDTARALDLIADAERAAWRREWSVPSAGLFEKLRIFRSAHVQGSQRAAVLAQDARERFAGRHPLFYLSVLSVTAWLQRRHEGFCQPETEAALAIFDRSDLSGLRALLKAQGFLA